MSNLYILMVLLFFSCSSEKKTNCFQNIDDLSNAGYSKWNEFDVTWSKAFQEDVIIFGVDSEGEIIEKHVAVMHSNLDDFIETSKDDSSKEIFQKGNDSTFYLLDLKSSYLFKLTGYDSSYYLTQETKCECYTEDLVVK